MKINFKILLIPLFLLTLFLVATRMVSAQVSDETVKKFGITFPIADLNNCGDYSSCRTYCEDPVNSTSCIGFAKEKGFYKEEVPTEEKYINAAKAELGCDSAASCMTFCDDSSNYEKCDRFAKKLSLSGGYTEDPGKAEIIEKAKEALGCESYGTCVDFCSQEANRQKCSEFAKEAGIRGGQQVRGPGGCATEGTCRSYCSDPNNFSECSKFAPPEVGRFKGPGGCDSPESCRSYCEKNPDSCRSYAPGASGRYVPINCPEGQYFGPGGACTPKERSQDAENCFKESKYWNGNSCQNKPPEGVHIANTAYFQTRPDMGNCSTPGSCYDWCRANPGKCSGFNPNSARPDSYTPSRSYSQPSYTPPGNNTMAPRPDMGGCSSAGSCYDWCKANPGSCGGFNPDSPRPTENYTPPANYTPLTNYASPTTTQTTQPQSESQPQTQPSPQESSPPVQGSRSFAPFEFIKSFVGSILDFF